MEFGFGFRSSGAPWVLAVAVSVVSMGMAGAAMSEVRDVRHGTLTVQRINVVEPDGTLRLVIAGRGSFPGAFERGTEIPRPDRNTFAGMLFLDDNGSEMGGLIYSGREGAEGIESGLSLTFDRYMQDQLLQLSSTETDGVARGGLMILDRPPATFATVFEQMRQIDQARALPKDKQRAFVDSRPQLKDFGQQRAYLGTNPAGQSTLELRDAAGRIRLRLSVEASGTPVIEMLDETGKVRRAVRYSDAAADSG